MPALLEIKQRRDTPAVYLDKESGTFKIEGRSLPENAFEFYKPVVDWLTAYSNEPNEETNLEINLEYMNSGSLKQLFSIIYIIEDLVASGNKNSKVTWYYRTTDELMLLKGEEFKEFIDVPVELIAL